MERAEAKERIKFVVDAALWGGTLAERCFTGCGVNLDQCWLVGWDTFTDDPDSPVFVACVGLDRTESIEVATDYMDEIKYFDPCNHGEPAPLPCFVFPPTLDSPP